MSNEKSPWPGGRSNLMSPPKSRKEKKMVLPSREDFAKTRGKGLCRRCWGRGIWYRHIPMRAGGAFWRAVKCDACGGKGRKETKARRSNVRKTK